MNLFKKKGAERLGSEADMVDAMLDARMGSRRVTIDKKRGDVGITLINNDEGEGVIISGLTETGNAIKAGLKIGDVILSVNSHLVNTHSEAIQLIDNSKKEIVFGLSSVSRPEGEHPSFSKRESSTSFNENSHAGLAG